MAAQHHRLVEVDIARATTLLTASSISRSVRIIPAR
jgi:hypothetical protein